MVISGRDAERDVAARFVARMDAGDWSEGDERALQEWLAADSMRHGMLLQVQAEWMALAPVAVADDVDQAPSEPAKWGRRAAIAALASTAAVAIVGVRLSQGSSEYATRLGEIRRLPLSDGSVMTINSGSNLTVAMEQQARQVDLTQGEAWFEVAKDAERPFIVVAGDVRVRAVGTAFSVRRRATSVEVQVTEGVVETQSDGAAGLKMRLTAGDRAIISGHSVVNYETGMASSVDSSLAWRSGMIDLHGRTLAEAAEEFNRYNQEQIVIADPHIAGEELDGLFRVNDPNGFAASVKVTLGVAIDSSEPNIIRITK